MASEGERRVALVVIHGIGKQAPLRTLGAFAQGVVRAAAQEAGGPVGTPVGTAVAAPRLLTERLGGRLRPAVRLERDGRGDLDVFEYHWAEHSVGRLGALEAFAWLLGVSVAGLDFRRQVPYLANGASPRRLAAALGTQLLQVIALAGGAAALFVAFLAVLGRADTVVAALRRAGRALPEPSIGEAALLLTLGCLVVTAVALGRDLLLSSLEAARVARRHGGRGAWAGMFGPASGGWRGPATAVAGGLVITAALVTLAARPLLGDYRAAAAALLAEPGIATAALALWVAAAARRYLLTHVADIALYVTSDRVSARARTRRAILDEGEALVRDLLAAGYGEVYLTGHSLGSVIALDILDRMARAPGAADDPVLRRVRGLLTFGSPLDKVAYFFRQRPEEGEAIRSQLISFLHGVRRRPGLRDYGPYLAAPYSLPFRDLRWWAVHAPGDVLSDRLEHYRVDVRVRLPVGNPLRAHQAYWSSDRFFRVALEWLDGEEPVLG